MGVRPPWIVKRAYKWTYLYAALDPSSGVSFCMCLPGMDDGCLEVFFDELSKRYSDEHLLVVLDGAPSHRSEQIVHPENISFLMLPPYSPELDPAERWFQEFRRSLSNRAFESVALMQDALTKTLVPYWKSPSLLAAHAQVVASRCLCSESFRPNPRPCSGSRGHRPCSPRGRRGCLAQWRTR